MFNRAKVMSSSDTLFYKEVSINMQQTLTNTNFLGDEQIKLALTKSKTKNEN